MSKNIPAENFVATLAVNVDNERISDAEFRQLVRNTLGIVEHCSACAKLVLDNYHHSPYCNKRAKP